MVFDPPADISLDGAVRLRGDYSGGVDLRSVRATHEFSEKPQVYAEPGGGAVILSDYHVTGSGAGDARATIELHGRDGSEFRKGCVDMDDDGQGGIYFKDSAEVAVADSLIGVPGNAVDFDNSTGITEGITYSGSCTATSDTSDSTDGTDDTDDTDEVTLSQTLTVRGTGTEVEYTIETTDGIVPGENGNTVTNPPTTVTETVAANGENWYWWDGEIVDLTLSGDAEVYVNGEQVDSESVRLPHAIVVDGRNGESDYEFTVSGDLQKSQLLASVEEADVVDGKKASGLVGSDSDGYRFSGNLTQLSIDGNATVRFE